MRERGRVADSELAVRINAAVELLARGIPVAEAAQILATRFDVSFRQGHRYADQAARSGLVAVPEPSVVFTVKLPASLAVRVRERARNNGVTISSLVSRALTDALDRSHRRRPGR